MKNIVVLFLSIMLFTYNLVKTKKTNCEDFYNHSSLLNVSFVGQVFTKNETELAYVFNIIQNDKHKVLKLYKSKISKDIFLFVQKGYFIKKNKEVIALSVVHYKENGNLEVKLFDKLCD